MESQTILDNLATIAEASRGVQRLRDLVLDLAIGGSLTEPRDDAASVVRRRSTPRNDGREYPRRWQTAKLCDIAEVRLGRQRSPEKAVGERMRPYLRAANVGWNGLSLDEVKEMAFTEDESASYELRAGDLLLAEASGSPMEVGKPAQYRGEIAECCFQNTLIRVRLSDGLLPDFYERFFRQQARSGRFAASSRGVGINHLGARTLADWKVPVPPITEQQQIVAKVDELMNLCDALETRQDQRQRAATRFRGSALHALCQAESAVDSCSAWERVSINWPALTDQPGSITDLRQTILQLAVQGRLVGQDKADGQASDEVESARAEKASALETRKQPSLPSPDVQQGRLPIGWTWALVDDLFLVTGGIQKSPKRSPREHHFPYLRVANVQRGYLDLREIERFELVDGELKRLRLLPGDLLVVEGNGSESEIGRCARWNGEIEDCVHQNHLIRCRPMLPDLEHYLLMFLNSPAGMATMKDLAVTTSGLYNLSVGKIRSIQFPIPPLAEQARIRAKVDELTRRCDELAVQLNTQLSLRESLAASFVNAVTGS